MTAPRSIGARRSRLPGVAAKSLAASLLAIVRALLPAEAGAETQPLRLQYWGARDLAEIVFKRDGTYDAEGLQRLNAFLRDRRSGEMAGMDPRLFDVLWEVYRRSGSRYPIVIVSGYRNGRGLLSVRGPEFCPGPIGPRTVTPPSPLARRMAGEAQSCLSKTRMRTGSHGLGRAVDFFMVDVSAKQIREILRGMPVGKVFVYSGVYAPVVHVSMPDAFGETDLRR